MTPMDSHPTSSAATSIPFDVLLEIFYHCLPDSPLDEAQPNTKIAPMLLCQVCSSWRRTTLESPRLWMYLYYRLPLRWHSRGTGPPIAWDSNIFLGDKECLKWWRQNQGSMAPFIRLECYQPQEITTTRSQELHLTHKDMTQLFIEFLSLAQHLDVADFALYVPHHKPIIYDSSQAPYSQAPYSNLQSLAISLPKSHQRMHWPPRNALDFQLKSLSPFYIGPTLRRLRIHHVILERDYMKAFTHWSGLTHISLHNVYMASYVWFSLIRAVPYLRWGFFDIFLNSISRPENPPIFTLPYLDTLSVTLYNSVIDDGEMFRQVFTNLHFPALRDLSLHTDAETWNVPSAAMKIDEVLTSAPAVRKFTIAFRFPDNFYDPLIYFEKADKLPSLVPHLTHLVLDMSYTVTDFASEARLLKRFAYWEQFFNLTRWLDLESPASVLRKISVVVKEPARDGPLVEGAIRDALELDVAGHDEETKIILEIIPEDKKGLAPYAEGYKTWGCSL